MNPAMHAYDKLDLFTTGLIFGIIMVIVHLVMLLKRQPCQAFLKKFPRNQKIGQVLVGIGLFWFWLLIAPEGKGIINSLAMDMTEFNGLKPYLRLLLPIIFVLVAFSIKEFLSVRALGLLGLLAAQLLLSAAYLKDPSSRLLIPIWTYAMIIASLFCVGMPFLFRDAITWVTAKKLRWTMMTAAGLIYGVMVITCALLFWK
jgi:hypothetical protein